MVRPDSVCKTHLKGPSGLRKRMPSTKRSWKSRELSFCMSTGLICQPRQPSRLPRIWCGLLLFANTLLPLWMPQRSSKDSTCFPYLAAICFTNGTCVQNVDTQTLDWIAWLLIHVLQCPKTGKFSWSSFMVVTATTNIAQISQVCMRQLLKDAPRRRSEHAE